MPPHVRNGLVLVGMGLLFMWLGLIWAANLFGVAAEHSRQILAGNAGRRWFQTRSMPFEHVFRSARLTGAGIMVFSLLWVVAGIVEFAGGAG